MALRLHVPFVPSGLQKNWASRTSIFSCITRTPALKQAEFLALNPNGQVPVLVDDDLVLFESLAITLHLARKYGERILWPVGESAQAQVLQWTLWAATEAEPPARQWMQHTQFFPEARRSAIGASWLESAREKVRLLDGLLATRRYLVGEQFTVADLNVAAVLQRLP